MRLNLNRLLRNPWAYPLVFSISTLASASFLLAALSERSGDPLRYGVFGLVNVFVIVAVLFVSVGDWSESGDSRPVRSFAFTAFMGGCYGLLPPALIPISFVCPFLLGTQGWVM